MIRFTHVKQVATNAQDGSANGPYSRPKYLNLASSFTIDEIETINAGGPSIRPWKKIRLDPAFKPSEEDD